MILWGSVEPWRTPDSFLFPFKIEIQFTYHEFHPFKVYNYNSVVVQSSPPSNSGTFLSPPPPKKYVPIFGHSPVVLSLGATNLLSISTDLSDLNISHK